MSAVSDYQQAVRTLGRPLPAYVTYAQHGHVKFDAISKNLDDQITVRTRDGKIVKGGGLSIQTGADSKTKGSVVTSPPFDPACYRPVSTSTENFEGRAVEAIAVKGLCREDKEEKDSEDFTTLYVDPATHDPIAAVGAKNEDPVEVRLEQHFARVGEYMLPSLLAVRVKGSGLMFWLDVDAHVEFTDYRFSDKFP